MQVYYYCSYTKSPVGFHLGVVDTEKICGTTCELSREGIPSFLWKCFSQGNIQKACGQLPRKADEKDQYFLLAKSKEPIKRDGIEYFINFALVTEQWTEYEGWFQDQTETDCFQAISETILPKGTSEFGFAVRTDGLNTLSQLSYHELFQEISPKKDILCIKTLSSRTDSAQLLDALGLTEYDVQKLENGNWFFLKKKQNERPIGMIAALVIASAAVLILILCSLIQKASAADETPLNTSKADVLNLELTESSGEDTHSANSQEPWPENGQKTEGMQLENSSQKTSHQHPAETTINLKRDLEEKP